MATVQQYNKKRKLQTRIAYDPVTVVFHDDNYGVTSALWETYYRYYYYTIVFYVVLVKHFILYVI